MKKTHIAGLIFIVIAIGAIISTFYSADTYASFEKAMQNPGREFRIIGDLIRDKPIEEKVEGKTLMLTFYMTDNQGGQSKVTYFGPRPQDFEKSDQVVLIGKYNEEMFVATSLLLKCPSKYNPEDLQLEDKAFSAQSSQ